jgi:hypothetical protein
MASKHFRLLNPDSMFKPTAGYSHVAEVSSGKIVFIAGQVAIDKDGHVVGNGDFRAQVRWVPFGARRSTRAVGERGRPVMCDHLAVDGTVESSALPCVSIMQRARASRAIFYIAPRHRLS